jgi:hypothetical protein
MASRRHAAEPAGGDNLAKACLAGLRAESAPTSCDSEVGTVATRIIGDTESAGANTMQISRNRGVLPHEMFIDQIRRFAAGVLRALQAHKIARVPLAENVAAQ